MPKYNKIYVVAPYAYATGGVELSHQLVNFLRSNNQNAYIVYTQDTINIKTNASITKEYINYNIQISNDIEDDKNNILILPEIYFDWIYTYKNIQIGCWWMSVDYHYKACAFNDALHFKKGLINKIQFISSCIKRILQHKYRYYQNNIQDLKNQEYRILHLYQSHYAQFHLYQLGFSKILPLSDYINCELINNEFTTIKEDIILYNPAKGGDFVLKLIKLMPEYKFIPLKGLTRTQLKELFIKAKLYIDFGPFPGKDRLPREAVANNCCIITGKKGASGFFEDVPISETYKFDIEQVPLLNIKNRIINTLNNYESCIQDFLYMKKRILKEKEEFQTEIKDLFI